MMRNLAGRLPPKVCQRPIMVPKKFCSVRADAPARGIVDDPQVELLAVEPVEHLIALEQPAQLFGARLCFSRAEHP